MSTPRDLDRRDFVRLGALTGAGLAFGAPVTHAVEPDESRRSTAASMIDVPFERHDVVRIGIVGTGLRGRSVLHEWLGVEHVQITALCDIVPGKAAQALDMVRKAGHDHPVATIVRGERGFEELVRRDDVDIVYTATPWEWHVPVCVAAMEHGKHVATEVPARTPSMTAGPW